MQSLKPSITKPARLFVSSISQFSSSVSTDKYFTQKKFDDLPIAQHIKNSLKSHGFHHLTEIQSLALDSLLNGKNSLIFSENGSGKTLTYVLPILNQIYTQNKYPLGSEAMRGALVIVPTIDLGMQVYSCFRQLDQDQIVRISRLGSLCHVVPTVPLADTKPPPERVRETIQNNLVNSLEWDNLDVLISTPMKLDNLLNIKYQKNPYDVNPRTVVLDECDLLLGDEVLSVPTKNLLRKFAGVHKSAFGEANRKRQFILSGSTAPRKSEFTFENEVKGWFVDLKVHKSLRYHKFSPDLEEKKIEIPSGISAEEEYDILMNTLNQSKAKKIIVFYNKLSRLVGTSKYFTQKGFYHHIYCRNSTDEEKLRTLTKFKSDKPKYRVLLSSDLGSRGIDFKNVEQIINFDFPANMNSALHRSGRVSRLGKKGEILNFVRKHEELKYSVFREIWDGKLSIEEGRRIKKDLMKKYGKSDGDSEDFEI